MTIEQNSSRLIEQFANSLHQQYPNVPLPTIREIVDNLIKEATLTEFIPLLARHKIEKQKLKDYPNNGQKHAPK